ncbi:hypothetical protein KTF61_07970 [Faecalibacterium prausnitzii]|nr:hypothetical protein [Faecalibacterium prausnitzii]MBU8989519.1 hypothetical protein [Faecalibacterium prausnitzii]MCQ5155593.1 hypothetical protein [Faecalibacterium prausnitzii]
MLTTLTAPAFAGTWYIEDGDITISAGESGNNVTQNENTTENDPDTIITNREEGASSHTVTIDAKDKDDKVEVTLKDVNIDASSRSEAAVSVTGKGDTTIELDGDNELKSGAGHAGLEHNKTDTSGELTIQDKDNNGSLEAAGGFKGAGIGSAGSNDAQVKITGGNITATSDDWGAGIGSGSYGTGTVEITGGEINATGGYLGAGIGGGCNGSGNVTISGGTITAAGSDGAAGIGGGYYNGATVTITGDAVIKNASSTKYGAGIGGGNGSDGNVTISGNAKIENATGGYGAAGIGGGAFSSPDKIGNGNVVIKDNAKIDNVQGGAYGAGIGGGIYGLSNVTIEGNTKVNATGGAGGAAIGGGAGAENNSDNNGNQITIKSNENGSPTINAVGGGTDEGEKIVIGGAGIGAGCESNADADITLEGKVTITATAGKDNVAIGANGIEQEFSGLAEGSSITRYDSEGNDTSLPGDKVPVTPVVPDDTSSGGSADASVQESVFPGLVVTDKDGQRISYTSIRGNNVLSLRVGRFTASLRASLATLRQLRAEGIDTITFQTILCSTTLSVDELLAMGGEDTEVVLTHHIRSSTLTVGGKAV